MQDLPTPKEMVSNWASERQVNDRYLTSKKGCIPTRLLNFRVTNIALAKDLCKRSERRKPLTRVK